MRKFHLPKFEEFFLFKWVSVFFRAIYLAWFHFVKITLKAYTSPFVIGASNLVNEENQRVYFVVNSTQTLDLALVQIACDLHKKEGIQNSFSPHASHPKNYFKFSFPSRRSIPKILNRFDNWKTRKNRNGWVVNLIKSHSEQTDDKGVFCPVFITLDRSPSKEPPLWSILLRPIFIRLRPLSLIFHRKFLTIEIGNPIDLPTFLPEEKETEIKFRKIHRLLRFYFLRKEFSMLGPDLSHRKTLIQQNINSTNVNKVISHIAKLESTSIKKQKRKAEKLADEITSDMNYPTLRVFDFFLTHFLNKVFRNISVNNIENVKNIADTHTIIYLPLPQKLP